MAYTAGDVMDTSAALLNDQAKSLYTYTIQLPYLKMAQRDFEQELALSGISLQLQKSANIAVAIGAKTLTLPADFFIPIKLEERLAGSTNEYDFFPMSEQTFSPSIQQVESLGLWDFRNNNINFPGATTAREVRLFYWRVLTSVVSELTAEEVSGGQNPLAFRTAALCSQYIGRNDGRAIALNQEAAVATERLVSLLIKNNQGKRVRRKPFRRTR